MHAAFGASVLDVVVAVAAVDVAAVAAAVVAVVIDVAAVAEAVTVVLHSFSSPDLFSCRYCCPLLHHHHLPLLSSFDATPSSSS